MDIHNVSCLTKTEIVNTGMPWDITTAVGTVHVG